MIFIAKDILNSSKHLAEKIAGTAYKVLVPSKSVKIDGEEITLYKVEKQNTVNKLDVFSTSAIGGGK